MEEPSQILLGYLRDSSAHDHWVLYHQTARVQCLYTCVCLRHMFASYIVECELYFPIVFVTSSESTTPPSESTTSPPESSNAGAIAGAAAAFGCIVIISISIIIIVIVVTRSHRARFDLHKEVR